MPVRLVRERCPRHGRRRPVGALQRGGVGRAPDARGVGRRGGRHFNARHGLFGPDAIQTLAIREIDGDGIVGRTVGVVRPNDAPHLEGGFPCLATGQDVGRRDCVADRPLGRKRRHGADAAQGATGPVFDADAEPPRRLVRLDRDAQSGKRCAEAVRVRPRDAVVEASGHPCVGKRPRPAFAAREFAVVGFGGNRLRAGEDQRKRKDVAGECREEARRLEGRRCAAHRNFSDAAMHGLVAVGAVFPVVQLRPVRI